MRKNPLIVGFLRTISTFCRDSVGCGRHTRCGGLWDGLVDAGAEAAADGNVTGGVVGLSALVPQLLLSPPLCSSI